MIPTWFQDAYDKGLSCEDLWDVVMYEGFAQFSFNRNAKPWSVEDCCMGNFSKAFDLQPGIQAARELWFAAGTLTAEQRQLILEDLEKRGLSLHEQEKQA